MSQSGRDRVVLGCVLLIAVCVFLTGIGWGLPSREVDRLLFGDRPVWSGQQIAQLAGQRDDAPLGADVDRNPAVRGQILNDTDARRAEIIRRYRLFSYQPDEVVTFLALASMNPQQRDFDPKLYQYGGLWVYPVAALLKIFAQPQSQVHYLDHPEDFGQFYVIARLYAAMWGLVGAWAVFRIARRSGAGMLGALGAILLYTLLPVVVNMSHEAKPHLPGAVLILLSAMSGARFVERGGVGWGLLTGTLCGMASGMILSAALAFAIIPAMVMMRAMSWRARLGIAAGAAALGAGVYFLTNPYVLIHLLGDDAVLRSNLGNTQAMYQFARLGDGIVNAGRLLVEGTTLVTTILGILGAVVLSRRNARIQTTALRLLLIVSALVLAQFIALAAGKPGEYGRFAVLPGITLALAAAVVIGRARIRNFEKIESLGLLVVLTVLPSLIYLRGFLRDSSEYPRRMHDARLLAALHTRGAATLGVFDEPAPYLLPPVDLFSWSIKLLPREFEMESGEAPVDVIVRPVDRLKRQPQVAGAYRQISERRFDDLFPSRISWASKAMEIWVRRELLDQ